MSTDEENTIPLPLSSIPCDGVGMWNALLHLNVLREAWCKWRKGKVAVRVGRVRSGDGESQTANNILNIHKNRLAYLHRSELMRFRGIRYATRSLQTLDCSGSVDLDLSVYDAMSNGNPVYTASHHKEIQSSSILLWEAQISRLKNVMVSEHFDTDNTEQVMHSRP